MTEDFENAYEFTLTARQILPDKWSTLYKVTACLKESTDKGTYLVKSIQDGNKYVLKTARGEMAEYLLREGSILKKLQDDEKTGEKAEGGAAIYMKDMLSEDDRVYLLKNYVTGISLAQKLEKCNYSDAEIVTVGIDLCREVRKLHHRKPPVIHRDIKPENIIIKSDGSLVLIDLETARTFKAGQSEDTRFVGTKGVAAPEQYGFGQSDERTDIYGIGMTLLYAKTGEYYSDNINRWSGNKKLNNIIKKCCSFDPDHRFSNVDQLIRSLEGCFTETKKYRNYIKILCVAAVLLTVISVCFFSRIPTLRPAFAQTVSRLPFSEEVSDEKPESYKGRIIIDGWDVTEYDKSIETILKCCDDKEYERLAQQCEQLLALLYADEKLMAVEAIDVYEYAEDDKRWREYNVSRMGYEMAADKLAYHNSMLQNEMGSLYDCRYEICMAIRNISEYTEVDDDGNLTYTLLYRYADKDSQGRQEIDYSVSCVLDGIITGVTLYHENNR